MNIIYGLVDGHSMELRYVGSTTAPRKRLSQHRCARHAHLPGLNRWLRSTHWKMITLERDPVDLKEAEIRWIREMREGGARLLNISPGGNGWSDESRAKLSVALKGRSLSAEQRAKISATLTGRPLSPETCAKMSASRMGRRCSAKQRARISASLMGHPATAQRDPYTGRWCQNESS
jgi:hypothetical protein